MCKAVLFCVVLVVLITGCKKEEEKKAPSKNNVEIVKEEKPVVEDKKIIPENENLLTGIPDLMDAAIGKRPVAVMVNNIQAAMPQYGVGKADIIFEIPVEGDVTRLMAMYADYTQVPRVCAVRSYRYYYPALSEGFDAFYIHWGRDYTKLDYLDSLNLDRFDGIFDGNGLFGRDQARLDAGYDLEHTGYFDGPLFASVVDSQGYRTDLAEDKKEPAFKFNGLEEQVKPDGQDCTTVDINFGQQTATFTYDADKQVYLKLINGTPHIDGNTNEQLSFTNLFVLETSITVRDEYGHKEIDWTGSPTATGYYISNGSVQKIHWMKTDGKEKSRLVFYDVNGEELSINRGKSYIALNYPNQIIFE